MSVKDTNPKDAIGIKKPSLSVVSFPVMFEIGNAMLEGACKYRAHNYRFAGVRYSVYINAALRHLALHWEGEDFDPDSGINHIGKALASLVVLRDSMMLGNAVDDRPPRSREDWMREAQAQTDAVLARHPNPEKPYTQVGIDAGEEDSSHCDPCDPYEVIRELESKIETLEDDAMAAAERDEA